MDEFVKAMHPIDIKYIEKPRGPYKGEVSMQFFPHKAIKGKGITKDYLLSTLRDLKSQGIETMKPSLGLTDQGAGFIENIEKAGYLKKSKNVGYTITDKVHNYKTKFNLTDIYNQSKKGTLGTLQKASEAKSGMNLLTEMNDALSAKNITKAKEILEAARKSDKYKSYIPTFEGLIKTFDKK